jgi:hypothetical protein
LLQQIQGTGNSTSDKDNTYVCKVEKYASVIVVYAVVQLVEALIYKPEGRGFDSQSGNWNFSST